MVAAADGVVKEVTIPQRSRGRGYDRPEYSRGCPETLRSLTHLHYEVLKDTLRLDPLNYLFASVSPDDYMGMLSCPSTPDNQWID